MGLIILALCWWSPLGWLLCLFLQKLGVNNIQGWKAWVIVVMVGPLLWYALWKSKAVKKVKPYKKKK